MFKFLKKRNNKIDIGMRDKYFYERIDNEKVKLGFAVIEGLGLELEKHGNLWMYIFDYDLVGVGRSPKLALLSFLDVWENIGNV